MPGSDIFIQSFTHLNDRPHAERALHILKRIASLVKPIMRKRNWVLPVLSEFFPDSPNLLDVNSGQKILVRLRPPHAPDTFLSEEDVLQTMLHELTHNVHGPHDEKFYKYLAGLQEEYDALRRSGYAGEGFYSEGKRLGTNVSHNLPLHMAKLKMLEAAEKRKQTSRVSGSSGRLGGAWTNGKNLTPREAAAQAAERRARDEKMCGSGQIVQQEAAKAAKESVESKVDIDLTLEDSDDDVIIVDNSLSNIGSSKVSIPHSSGNLPRNRSINNVVKAVSHRSSATSLPRGEWSCPQCTLINIPTALQCDVCMMTRPTDRSAGWDCLACGKMGMPNDFWTCSLCGTVKTNS
ncbi:WLM domain-containing protein [Cyathus striatus]|nr:WLM domain-containing protein [Cyathus striatus]